jgi:hypothetical protein
VQVVREVVELFGELGATVPRALQRRLTRMRRMRLPVFSRGVTSFLWAVVFALYIWFGGVAVGISGATSFVLGVVAGAGIFLYVRIYGDDAPRP